MRRALFFLLLAILACLAVVDSRGGSYTGAPADQPTWNYIILRRLDGTIIDTTGGAWVTSYCNDDDTTGTGDSWVFQYLSATFQVWRAINAKTCAHVFVKRTPAGNDTILQPFQNRWIQGHTVGDSCIWDSSAFYSNVIPEHAFLQNSVSPRAVNDAGNFTMNSLVLDSSLTVTEIWAGVRVHVQSRIVFEDSVEATTIAATGDNLTVLARGAGQDTITASADHIRVLGDVRFHDRTDISKVAAFDLSNLDAATTSTLEVPKYGGGQLMVLRESWFFWFYWPHSSTPESVMVSVPGVEPGMLVLGPFWRSFPPISSLIGAGENFSACVPRPDSVRINCGRCGDWNVGTQDSMGWGLVIGPPPTTQGDPWSPGY